MRVLIINCVCGIRSTGRICTDLADEFLQAGNVVRIAYGRIGEVPEKYRPYAVRIGTEVDCVFHALRTKVLDQHGFGSQKATFKFLQWVEKYNPDLIWLHNIHGYYINVEMLFAWIKRHPQLKVKWTLHDCWAFTGHCAYFSVANCEQWKIRCVRCPQLHQYPSCFGYSNVSKNFERKKNAFQGVSDMTLITPSRWLANLVKQSFLQEYPIEVRYNEIDNRIFKPTLSDFRQQYNLQDKTIVLGVASTWDERKGLDVFLKLSKILNDEFSIVLVGLNKKQIRKLPQRIIGIGGTNNIQKLVEIYSAADVFVNPSLEETFGLTSVEALACGTPAVVYQDTACAEIVEKDTNGIGCVVKPDINDLVAAIKKYQLYKYRNCGMYNI